MQEGIEQNALELLHAIREHHPDIYAGAWVNPYTAALEAGLDPDSTHYRVAMEYLQAEDLLEEAEESRELGGGGPLYTITLRGMEMLREVRFWLLSAPEEEPKRGFWRRIRDVRGQPNS